MTARQRTARILGLALPIIGGMLSQNLLNLVDTAMVGQLGAPALGAVGFGGMVNWMAGSFFLGMGAGVQAIAARRLGEKNLRGGVEALHGALVVAAVVVLPFALLLSMQSRDLFGLLSDDPAVIAAGVPYLAIRLCSLVFVVMNFSFRGYWNGTRRSTVYLRTIVMIHAVNILLNWLLIYGNLGFPRLEVLGAGIASAVAVAIGTLTYFVLAWRRSRADGFLCRGALPTGTIAAVLRLSVPAGVQNLFLSSGYLAFYRIAQLLGTAQLAATNVLSTLSLVCVLPALGFGLASTTLVGESLGAKQPKEAARWGWTTVMLAIGAMLVFGGTLAAAPELWLSLLMKDPVAEAMAVAPLILLGLMQPIDSIGIVLSQSLIGAGAVRSVTITSVLLQWVFFLPAAYIAAIPFQGGLLSLWIALAIWRAAFSLVMVVLFARGRWATIKV